MTSTSEGKIGKYEIVRVLRRGGMGEVLLAQDKDLGRMVAIKRPLKSALHEGLARFQLEARAATLNHRNIPAIYELGVEDGLPFIAMEYVEGEPLDKIIASGRHLELITKLGIIEQVCSALEHAHQKGIIHRDIKPDNVIVQPDGVVKIIDFGIAKLKTTDPGAGLTQPSHLIGTLHYIAPERFRGEAVDGRADIFSTGVMLYLLLTGELPFPGAEATASYKIVNEPHVPLATHLQNYPPALDTILDRALAKSPSQRYATAEDFAEALHEVIDGLKRDRVVELFDDAERLTTERRFEPALELLNEAMTLDPANTQVRKLRKFVREQHDKTKREEHLRELFLKADEALIAGKYMQALTLLKEASDLDPANPELLAKIRIVDEKKRAYDRVSSALASADAIHRKDINGAIRIIDKALKEDSEEVRLLSAKTSYTRQAEAEAQPALGQDSLENARAALASRQFDQVEALLLKAMSIDSANPEIERIASEMVRLKDQDEQRRVLEEIQRRVHDLTLQKNYDQALELIDRSLNEMPGDTTLLRLKQELTEQAQQLASARQAEQLTSAQQTESLLQRVAVLKQQNHVDEAILLLRQQLAATPNNAAIAQQLNALVSGQRQVQSNPALKVSIPPPPQPPPPPLQVEPKATPPAETPKYEPVKFDPQQSGPLTKSDKKAGHALIWLLGALFLIALSAGAFLWWKLHPSPVPQAHLRIAKAPPGALVSIDHGAAQMVDASGQYSSNIQVGDRMIEISKPGFLPFSEKVLVGVGETVNYPSVTLVPTPVVGTSGRLIPQGNLPDYRLTIDHEYRGILHQGDPVQVEQGPHTIRYENADDSDSQEHQLTIVANQDLTDSFTLKAPKETRATNDDPAKGPISHDDQMHDNPARADAHSGPSLHADSAEATVEKITQAHDRFEAAYDSKDIDQLKAEWLDIGKQRTDQMTDIFKRADTVIIHEKCPGQPVINGSTADWRCTEIVQLNKNFFGPSPKTLEFAKVGSRWVLKDK